MMFGLMRLSFTFISICLLILLKPILRMIEWNKLAMNPDVMYISCSPKDDLLQSLGLSVPADLLTGSSF